MQMYAGDSKNIIVSVTDEGGSALDISGATFVYELSGREVVKKDGIISGDSEVTFKLSPEDTLGWSGVYPHEVEMTDAAGNISTVYHDLITIQKPII